MSPGCPLPRIKKSRSKKWLTSVQGINFDPKVTFMAALDWTSWRIFPITLLTCLYVVIALFLLIKYQTRSKEERKNLFGSQFENTVWHGSRRMERLLIFWLARKWKDWTVTSKDSSAQQSTSSNEAPMKGLPVPKTVTLARENQTGTPRTQTIALSVCLSTSVFETEWSQTLKLKQSSSVCVNEDYTPWGSCGMILLSKSHNSDLLP